jgi:hypothetical protein
MSSVINNLFSNLNNLTKHSTRSDMNRVSKNMHNSISSPALNQGEKFKRYQKRIITNLEKRIGNVNSKEGFTDLNIYGNILTNQTNSVIRKDNSLLQNQNTVDNLKQEYKSTINEYKKLVEKIKNSTTNYLDRVNPNNPYLGKNVCLSDGTCGYVTQKGVFKVYPDTDTFNNTAGKNGCPKSAYIKINGQGNINNIGSVISSIPPLIVGTPMQSGQSCGNEGSTIVVDRLISNPTVSYVGCYADNSVTPLMTFIGDSPLSTQTTDSSSSGVYTYDQCKSSAIDAGYRYFALQGVDYSTSKGYCAATNDNTTAMSLGNSYIITSQVPLWASGTTGDNQGSIAVLNGDGTLVVNNTSGTTIFTTPVPESVQSQPNPYIGCYTLNNQTKDYEIADRYTLTFDQCQDLATDKGYQYFGVGGNNRQDIVKRCIGFNDLQTAQQNGLSKKCKDQTSGGSSAASIYATDNNDTLGNSFLILQEDGNMCIYGGTSPSDNQGLIWTSGTNGKQQASNPIYAAANGKYGKNWIISGSTLAAGEFIGSITGNIALIMQTDGNLVLYTFTNAPNCKKMSDGNYGAGIAGNALYDIGKVGNLASLSKTGYIDQDSKLHASKTTEGFDVTSASNIPSVDSIKYDRYIEDEDPETDGLEYANSVQKEQLLQLQNKLNELASQISSYTNNYDTKLVNTQSQSQSNTNGIQVYLDSLNTINNKINNFDTNIENILNDSDIVVLQKNYNYLFWSILAAGSVLVAMNITKK